MAVVHVVSTNIIWHNNNYIKIRNNKSRYLGTMKKNISKRRMSTSIIVGLFLILIMSMSVTTVVAWDDCPFGEVNDTYPGKCGRYIDTDGDGICDLSQPSPEDRVELQEEDDKGDNTSSNVNSEDNTTSIQEKSKGIRIEYFFIPITLLLVVLYLASLILSRKKKITTVQHRKIWNFLLLITFLVSGILGILLVLKVSFGIEIPFHSDALFFHVEFGIAMTFISIFHILWHWKYFAKMISKNR
jgi:hypothetical protein